MVVYFASTTLPELGIVLGTVFTGFGAMLLGFYKYAQAREKDFAEQRKQTAEAYEKSNNHLKVSLDRVAKASESTAEATTKAAKEAEKRNGHLAEITIEARDTVISHIAKQTVTEQHVTHQTVEETSKE